MDEISSRNEFPSGGRSCSSAGSSYRSPHFADVGRIDVFFKELGRFWSPVGCMQRNRRPSKLGRSSSGFDEDGVRTVQSFPLTCGAFSAVRLTFQNIHSNFRTRPKTYRLRAQVLSRSAVQYERASMMFEWAAAQSPSADSSIRKWRSCRQADRSGQFPGHGRDPKTRIGDSRFSSRHDMATTSQK